MMISDTKGGEKTTTTKKDHLSTSYSKQEAKISAKLRK